ncbi:Testis-expressed protein 11 [Balamuthia mandrillaris]
MATELETTSLQELKDLVAGIEEKAEREQFGTIDIQTLRTCVSNLVPPSSSSGAFMVGMKALAFRLWNVGVQMTQKKVVVEDLNPRIRHIACDLLSLATMGMSLDGELLNIALEFFARTGKMWSEMGHFTMAQNCFRTALSFWEKAEHELTESECTSAKAMLCRLYIYWAEAEWEQKLFDEAFNMVTKAREYLQFAPEELHYLAMLCYNRGVHSHQQKDYSRSVSWLQTSYDILDTEQDPSDGQSIAKQARTLRLLAHCFISLGQYDRAKQCAQIASELQENPSVLYLLAKLQLLENHKEAAQNTLERLLKHKEANTLEMGLAACELAREHKKPEIAMSCYKLLAEMYRSNNAAFCKIRCRQFELLICEDGLYDMERATSFVEEITHEHNSGKHRISGPELKQFHQLMWNAGATFFQREEYEQSLKWFELSRRMLEPNDTVNQANCLRIISRCHLLLKQYEMSLENANAALQIEANAFTYFLIFLIQVHMGHDTEAVSALRLLCQSDSFDARYLDVAAEKAWELKRQAVAVEALESIINTYNTRSNEISSDGGRRMSGVNTHNSNKGYLGKVLRNLIKLTAFEKKLSEDEDKSTSVLSSVSYYMKLGAEKIKEYGTDMFSCPDELEWLIAVCWDFGKSAAKANEMEIGRKLFRFAYVFSEQLEMTAASLETMKTSLLCSISCQLEHCAVSLSTTEACLHAVIEDVNTCYSLCMQQQRLLSQQHVPLNRPKQHRFFSVDKTKTSTDESSVSSPSYSNRAMDVVVEGNVVTNNKVLPLLKLMELHARALLHQKNLVEVIKSAAALEGTTAELFEMMAEICLAKESKSVPGAIESLKLCLNIILKQDPLDCAHCSKLYRKLIMLHSRDDSMTYYAQALSLLSKVDATPSNDTIIPLEELRWLITTAWNNGAYKYKLLKFEEAERWMSMAFKFLRYFPQKQDFEEEMMSSYLLVLGKTASSSELMEE